MILYKNTLEYQLLDASDGEKILYAVFSDDAGNLFGSNGEASISFTLDQTSPSDNQIQLLNPSPRQSFDTPTSLMDNAQENLKYNIECIKAKRFLRYHKASFID